jgi:hypothetical protein
MGAGPSIDEPSSKGGGPGRAHGFREGAPFRAIAASRSRTA